MTKLLFFATKHSWLWLLITLSLTGYFTFQTQNLKIDTTTQRLMSADDPDRLIYYQAQEKYGSDEILSVIFDDPELFTPEKLALIQERLYLLQLMPEVYKLESAFNTNNFFNNEEDILETTPIFDQIPTDTEEVLRRIDIGRNNPLFFNTLISAERSSLALHLYSSSDVLSDPAFSERFVKNVQEWIDPIKEHYEDVFIVGGPKLNVVVKDTMFRDIVVNFPISLLVICILLYLILGTWNASVIPIVTGCISVIWTLGTLAMLDIPFQLLFTAIPVILVVIGSTEDTHIISGYLDSLEKNSKRLLAIELMSHRLSSPILLTTLTTAVGFSSIMINEVIMLKEFGLITSISILYNFFITITLVPIILKYFGTTQKPEKKSSRLGDQMVSWSTNKTLLIASSYRREAVLALVFVCAVSAYFVKDLKADNDPLNSLKESSELKQNLRKMTRYFTGNDTFFISLTAKEGESVDFKKFEHLQIIEEIELAVEMQGDFDTSRSLASLISLINRELNKDEINQFVVPQDNALISQYLLFLSVDDKEKYVTSDYKEANIVVWYQLSSSEEKLKAIRALEQTLNELLVQTPIKAKITGRSILVAKAAETIISSQVKSLALIIFCVFVIIGVLFWDLKLALLSLIPNTIPILFLFGVLGFTGIPLDFVTCNIAAIAIGIALDDTIHFLSKFNHAMKNHHDQYLALKETLEIEMRPILSTSIALALGLFTLALSDFVTIMEFGILTGVVILLALVADLLLTPLFLILFGVKSANTLFDRLRVRINYRLKFDCMAFRHLDYDEIRRLVLKGKMLELRPSQVVNLKDDDSFTIVLEGEAHLQKLDQRSIHAQESRAFNLAKLKPTACLPPIKGYQIEAVTIVKILIISPSYLRQLSLIDYDLFEKLSQNLDQIKAQGF
jgi:uncharacterized protein